MSTTTQIQYQHDYRPGRFNLIGQQKPQSIIDLFNAADTAERYHLAVADEFVAGRATQEELTDAEELAEAAEKLYQEAVGEWKTDESELFALAHPGACM